MKKQSLDKFRDLRQGQTARLKCSSVLVDYDERGAITKAIEANKFEGEYFIKLSFANIPLIGSGRVKRKVYEVNFGRVMYNRDLPQALKKRGRKRGFKGELKFADPLTVLRYVLANFDKQKDYPLAIQFADAAGRLYILCANGFYGKRFLHVRRCNPNGFWSADVRFLAGCDPPPGA